MDYEKKYKEALERAKLSRRQLLDIGEEAPEIEFIFPELKESEDEKWRKWLINHLKGYINETNEKYGEVCKEAIAWLEKQGDTYTKKDVDDAWLKGICDAKRELEKQSAISLIHSNSSNIGKDEQKTEPKFKVCDWIINNDKRIAVPTQILKIEKDGYLTSREYILFDKVKTDYHRWTIEDAKDGDVLCCDNSNDGSIYFFKEQRGSSNIASAYFQILDLNNELRVMFNKAADFNLNVKPATNQQRKILFQKMKEAGYEWDAEEKVLNKIE